MIIRIILYIYISLIYPHFSPLYHCEFVIVSFFEWTRLNMLFWVACQVLEVFKFAKTGSQGHHCRCTQKPQLPSAARYFFSKNGWYPKLHFVTGEIMTQFTRIRGPLFSHSTHPYPPPYAAHLIISHWYLCNI